MRTVLAYCMYFKKFHISQWRIRIRVSGVLKGGGASTTVATQQTSVHALTGCGVLC